MNSLKMLTTGEVAERMGVAYTTVMLWLKQGKLAGAVKHDHPRGDYWQIPESSLKTLQRGSRGRPANPKPEEAAAKKSRKRGVSK